MTLRNPLGPLALDRTTSGGSAHLVGGSAHRLRREMNAVDHPEWDLTVAPSMTTSAANSVLAVNMGTTAGATSSLMTKESFTVPFRVVASLSLSQKIAQNEVYVEAVAVNEDGSLDETRVIAWRIAGSDSTNTSLAVYDVQNGGASRLRSGAVSTVAHAGSTPAALWELEVKATEAWFHARVADSSGGRAQSYRRDSVSTDPNRRYKVRIRWVNGATAPATATTTYIGYIAVNDYTEIDAEITHSRGQAVEGQSLAIRGNVNINNSPTVIPSAAVTANEPLSGTNLGVGGVYTQTTADTGTTVNIRPTRIRPTVMHLAGQTPGSLVLQESENGTTWRETARWPIPSDGLYHTFEATLHTRYHRLVFTNGATAQTGFWLAAQTIRSEGIADVERNLSFPLTPAAGSPLAAAGVFTGPILDLGGNHGWNLARLFMVSDAASAAGGVFLQQSMDGTTWASTSPPAANTAGNGAATEERITTRYIRAVVVNGATAATALRAAMSLVTA